ncbi:MAG: hypothetical protein KAH97_09490, partial [Anaerolineales bacterium]|nr:hypothetical protein [Anaerolineales bacterium]
SVHVLFFSLQLESHWDKVGLIDWTEQISIGEAILVQRTSLPLRFVHRELKLMEVILLQRF